MNLIIMIFLISLLVLVHEWGHYIAARMFGVKVSKFGIGMPIGPVLFKMKKGELEILVHAFLLGGYVSFPDDDEDDTLPQDSKERLTNQEPWKRAIIVSAGVIMNMLFALLLVIFTACVFHKLPTGTSDVYVDGFVENSAILEHSPDALKLGDKILTVNGIKIDSFYKFVLLVQNSREFDGYVSKQNYERNLKELLSLNPKLNQDDVLKEGAIINLPKPLPEEKFVADKDVLRGLSKYKTSEIELSNNEIKLRDEISGKNKVKLNTFTTLSELALALSDTYKPLNISVERKGDVVEIDNIKVPKEGVLGIKIKTSDIYAQTKNIKAILTASAKYTIRSTKYMCYGFWQLVTGKIPASEMHGIIAITKIGSDIIEHQGMLNALLLVAMISINLAIINLLPIPALDGGHLLFILIEKIQGKKPDKKTVELVSNACFTLLIVLMVLVLLNDVWALIAGKF